MLVSGAVLLFTIGSCSNGDRGSADAGLKMDSASVAERARDAATLSTLEKRKLAAERRAEEASAKAKEAKRIERDAVEAADQAEEAFDAEAAAQRSRQNADDQAAKAKKASDKAGKN